VESVSKAALYHIYPNASTATDVAVGWWPGPLPSILFHTS